MPFTLSHPAAVAVFGPLVREDRLPLAALAIGAMSPDFEYLGRLRPEWQWSHAPLGVLLFCLPTGLIALWLWVRVVREPLRALLALPRSPLATPGRWWIAAGAAILAGAATHVVWDAFTHAAGWAAALAPGLGRTIAVGALRLPLHNLLQHLSTALGGLVVLVWLGRALGGRTRGALRAPWRLAVLASFGVVAVAVGVWNAARWGVPADYWTLEIVLGRAAVGGLVALAIALPVYGAVYRFVAPA
jgi:hypothetical protein